MLRSLQSLEGCAIGATDGLIGQVRDFYFDDEAWVVRYLVVMTDAEQLPHSVLISPISVAQPDWSDKILRVHLTRAQVNGSPGVDTDKPVSRQQELGYLGYFGFGKYWGGGGLWGAGLYPDILQAGRQPPIAAGVAGGRDRGGTSEADPHLRSVNALLRYYVHASDGDIGHVAGFLVEERTWAIRYLIVTTSNWWLGHRVLISPEWTAAVDWLNSRIALDLSRAAIQAAPPYDPRVVLDSTQMGRIQAHYAHHANGRSASSGPTAAG